MLKTVISLGLAALVAAQPDAAGSADAPMRGDDGAWGSKSGACDACKFHAAQSCTYYLTARCYVSNSVGLDKTDMADQASDTTLSTGVTTMDKTRSDRDNWHWTFNAGNAGANYKLCFGDGGASNIDNFGDKYDPNDSASMWKKCTDQMAA